MNPNVPDQATHPSHDIRVPWSSKHPYLFKMRVMERRIHRFIKEFFSPRIRCQSFSAQPLPYRVTSHTSRLIPAHHLSEPSYLENKIKNLKRAMAHMNNILIHPGETFSFWHTLGRPSESKGYCPGPELRNHQIIEGIGGGLCHLSSLIHWLSLHSELKIIERHTHSVDLHPDRGRILPYGSDAAVFYNYKDLQIFNPTTHTFQFNFNITTTHLRGEIRSTTQTHNRYHLYEVSPLFIKCDNHFFRRNQLWRTTLSKGHNPRILCSQLMYINFVRILYTPERYIIA